jgi:hypothetical protein|tara:strand:+ start:1687 stop:2292 length:606 start_codon:yes stop_codon:yes gene_type:complete
MKQKDFSRVTEKIRNQMTKYADKVIVGQYTGEKEPQRNEGDEWTDRDGKLWTVKNGIKQSITLLQDAKTPWWCPACEKVMDSRDVKAWRIHLKCFDCVAQEETRLKLDGKWEDHRDRKDIASQIDYLKDRIVELQGYHDTLSTPEIYHFDDKTGTVLMVDKYKIPLDTIREDLTIEIENMTTVLEEKETEYKERFGERNGI